MLKNNLGVYEALAKAIKVSHSRSFRNRVLHKILKDYLDHPEVLYFLAQFPKRQSIDAEEYYLNLIKAAAEMNFAPAMNKLAELYLDDNRLVPQAICLFHSAAEMGDKDAMRSLVFYYRQGLNGLQQNDDMANKYEYLLMS